MTSRRSLRFTSQARSDLRSIQRYTRRVWGERQREAYADRLTAAMRELTTFPELGRRQVELSAGVRSRSIGEHVIYYRADADAITIVRILHAKMNAAGQLDQP